MGARRNGVPQIADSEGQLATSHWTHPEVSNALPSIAAKLGQARLGQARHPPWLGGTPHQPSSTATGPRDLDALNGAYKIGPKAGHKGLQVQNPGDRGLAGTAGPLKSAV